MALKWRLVQLEWLGKAGLLEIQDAKLTANARPKKDQPVPKLYGPELVQRLHEALSEGDLSVRRP